ncbi:MAG: hypothetical protein ACI399_06580 [Candidatus Cryptobacteroides sp.]
MILKEYSSSSSGTVKDRMVEPFEFTNNHIDIWAYDCEKEAVLLYKIARIAWVEMSLRARNLLCEEFPLAAHDVTRKDGKYIFDSMVTHMEGVGRFVIGLAADVKIIDSPELEEYVKNYRNQYLTDL